MNTVDAIASSEHVSVQERVVGEVRWVALRARGADWSWLTPEEAVSPLIRYQYDFPGKCPAELSVAF